MKLNCVVVDDSTIQRITLSKLVNDHAELNLIGDFSNASETRNCILNKTVHLLFLDIEMPVQTGFDLLDGLKTRPQIIFVSAKSDYALKAFDYDAIDYLQKPLTRDRFNRAVQKAIDFFTLKKDGTEEEGEFFFVKSNLKNLKVYINKIRWVEAFGDYIKIITDSSSHLVLSTMKDFEAQLPKDKFLRVHKSYIVNLDKVQRYNSKVAEIGTTKIPLSRTKKEELAKMLNKPGMEIED
jgi:two-component system LytT family response regulator